MTSDNRRPPDDNIAHEGDDAASEFESADQYVRAHELIESLRAERRPTRDAGGDDDARLHATAALLHAAASEAATVDPSFAARLFTRLEAEQALPPQQAEQAQPLSVTQPVDETPAKAPSAGRKRSGVSRRGLVWGGLGAAAAALAGAAVTAAIERPAGAPPAPPTSALVPAGAGEWVAIAALDALPVGVVRRFEAGAVIGFLQRTESGFVARSGVCTHMACLLQWNGSERTFDCPCHGGRFLANGEAAPGARYAYPPLPSIQTKVEANQVWVYVTGSTATATDPQAGSATTPTPGRGYGASGG